MTDTELVQILQQEVATTGQSQSQLAQRLGVSTSLLSQVLRGIYPGNTDNLKIRVKGVILRQTVSCPVKGEIYIHECASHQEKPFSSANRERVKMYRACRSGCQHSRLEVSVKAPQLGSQCTSEEMYNLADQLAYLKRTAEGDPARLSQGLEKELSRLAARYNQLLWKQNYSRREP
ncbi:helix-turn-helix domain-containing protein [Thaumasiovibrio sp. DFM-14]|uniref:helix-turn-helix domain-containing protein n=1 Tax=Thaumasiovibrio sp. DFM-14 TaxID=3384792 RepID=UPI0039A31903